MKTILIADDSASMRKLLETILEGEGYGVLTAEDGREALKLAFDNDIQAIIADEQMPGLTGSEFFKILNTDPEKRSIPRVMISGHAEADTRSTPELYDAFVAKNADLRTQLIAALDKIF
jgi:CheY-like chemotaxis protein